MTLSSKIDLARAIFGTDREPTASVTRITGTATADSEDGTVTVELEDGDIIEVGTIGAVTQGQTVTVHVQRGSAQVIAAEGWGDAMQEAVDEAQAIAEATNQHFWSDTNGAHVTQVTQEEWETTPTGPNALWNSLGMLLRNALTNLAAFTTGNVSFYDGNGNAAANITASFGNSGVQIGKTGESHIEMDYHSMRLIDKDGDTYFEVEDMRDTTGKATIVQTFPSGSAYYALAYQATDTSYTVTVSDSSGGTVTKYIDHIEFSSPTSGTVTATYDSESDNLKVLTFGTRSGTTGGLSFACGDSVEAAGFASHAEGDSTTASGFASHAEGYGTTASGEGSHAGGSFSVALGRYSLAHGEGTITAEDEPQTAIGSYNYKTPNAALVIGNGTGSNARSNAFTVDWSGNVAAAGGLTLGGKAVAAWVVETGTNNGWTYEKYSNGTYRATWSGNIALNSGTSWGGFYYHQQTAAINVPSFSTGFEVVSAVKNNSQLAWYVGRVVSTTSLQGYWVNGNSGSATAATFGTTTYTIEGTY